MNGKVLTRRFNQTLGLYITCHLTPAGLCPCKAIKRVSEDVRAPGDTKQTPSAILLYQHFLGEMDEVMLLCLHDLSKCGCTVAILSVFHMLAHPCPTRACCLMHDQNCKKYFLIRDRQINALQALNYLLVLEKVQFNTAACHRDCSNLPQEKKQVSSVASCINKKRHAITSRLH